MCAYIHVYQYEYIHTCVCIHVHYMCMYEDIYMFAYIQIYICVPIYISKFLQWYSLCAYTYTYIHTINVCMHTFIPRYIDTYMCVICVFMSPHAHTNAMYGSLHRCICICINTIYAYHLHNNWYQLIQKATGFLVKLHSGWAYYNCTSVCVSMCVPVNHWFVRLFINLSI